MRPLMLAVAIAPAIAPAIATGALITACHPGIDHAAHSSLRDGAPPRLAVQTPTLHPPPHLAPPGLDFDTALAPAAAHQRDGFTGGFDIARTPTVFSHAYEVTLVCTGGSCDGARLTGTATLEIDITTRRILLTRIDAASADPALQLLGMLSTDFDATDTGRFEAEFNGGEATGLRAIGPAVTSVHFSGFDSAMPQAGPDMLEFNVRLTGDDAISLHALASPRDQLQ